MKISKILLLIFIAALFTVFNLKAQNKSVSKRVFENAGISRQHLNKVDFDYTNLIYKDLTENFKRHKVGSSAPGSPVITENAEGFYVSSFIRSQSPLKTKDYIESINGNVSNIIEDILVVDVPVDKAKDVILQKEISRIETAKYSKSFMDTSLTFINIDDVHNGDDLPKPYKGEGVIVGVVDSGIDWTHPAFSGENGTRIQYLWDMSDDSNPPDDFDYGTEYTKEDIDAGNVNQKDFNGHGTHVTSTAAGNAGTDYDYTGVAPKSDIIFVKGFREGPRFAENDIINGCDYIFQKAEELGKPVVTNLSLGGLRGNTGYSLYEEALMNLIEPGKLIAAAAGNDGSRNLHLKYTMSGSSVEEGSETYWFVTDESNEATIIKGFPKSEDFTVGLRVYSQDYQEVYTSDGIGFNETFTNTVVVEEDTLGLLSLASGEDGNDPYVFQLLFQYFDESYPTDEYIYSLYTYGSAEFNAWISNGIFSSASLPSSNIYGGDSLMTIGSPSTAYKVICVGSFSTKLSWTNINGDNFNFDGTIKDRSSFSSMGPTRDGRIKPDISAPGQLIAAARSADGSFPEQTLLSDKVVLEQGTSMATPHITGLIALLLEQNPNLTYEETLDALQSTAVTDELTGEVPNNEFGAGRVDAHAALERVITDVDNESEIPDEFSLSQNYPNPFNPETTIKYQLKTTSNVNLNVYNILGKKVAELVDEVKSAGSYQVSFDASDFASGIYFYRINAGSFNQVRKMMLVK